MNSENTIQATGNFITQKGLALIAKLVASGNELLFSRAAAGTGSTPEGISPEEMDNLNAYQMDADISDYGLENGNAYVTIQISSDKVSAGFLLSEVGVYALDPDEGEILYAYMDVSSDPTYIYEKGSSNRIKFAEFTLYVLIGRVTKVNAYITPGSIITRAELDKDLEKKVTSSGGDVSETESKVTEPSDILEKYPDITAGGGSIKILLGKLLRWVKSLRTDKVDTDDFENHNHDNRYYTELEMNTELEKKVTSNGGDIAATKVGSFTASLSSFPIPAENDTMNVFGGKLKKYLEDIRNTATGACFIGQIVNNCITNNAKLPLSAAQGKVLMDLYTVLNTKLTALETYTAVDITSNIKTAYVQKSATTYAKYLKIGKIVILCLYDFDVKVTSAATSASIPILTGLPPARQAVPQQFRHGENTIRFIISGTSLNLHYCYANETVSVNDFIVYVTN